MHFLRVCKSHVGNLPAQAHEIWTCTHNIHFNIHAFEAIWSVYVRYFFLHRLLEFNFKEWSLSGFFCSIWIVKACMLGPFACTGSWIFPHTQITYTDNILIWHPQNWTVLRFAEFHFFCTGSWNWVSLACKLMVFHKIVIHVGGAWGPYFCTGSWNSYALE